MQTIYYASIANLNLNSFEYVFAKQIKVHQFFFFNCISKLPKNVQKSSIFAKKSPFLRQKNYRNLSLSGQKLSIMTLENSSDYRHFDNDKLSIANTTHDHCHRTTALCCTYHIPYWTFLGKYLISVCWSSLLTA
jgi:hypothetical protein